MLSGNVYFVLDDLKEKGFYSCRVLSFKAAAIGKTEQVHKRPTRSGNF